MNLPLALLPNLAGPDGLLIFLIVLLLFGAKKLPELARGLGSAVREFSKAKDEIEHEVTRPPATPPAAIESPKPVESVVQEHPTPVETVFQPSGVVSTEEDQHHKQGTV